MLSDLSRDILVIDEDPITYQILQNCFFSKDVAVHWAKTAQQALSISIEMRVVLCATPFENEDSYELLADIGHRHPNAIMFMLPSSQDQYDAFQSRNAGAVGAFFKPLSFATLESRLEEFLGIQSLGSLDNVDIPSKSDQVAKLISYQTSSPEIQDIENIVREVLPVVVEKVLRVQLQHNSILREIVEREVQDVLATEVNASLRRMVREVIDKNY